MSDGWMPRAVSDIYCVGRSFFQPRFAAPYLNLLVGELGLSWRMAGRGTERLISYRTRRRRQT
jgi:hypothetical protein